jgi:peptidoglycan/LPS O-acetylase OafA/YrhL
MTHRPELDGLRGVAILIVLAAHTGVPGFADGGGGAGVTLFFVLSGYLITSLLLAERTKLGRVDLRAFYVRRALRLFPALVAVLIAAAVLLAVGVVPRAATYDTNYGIVFAGVIFYVANWVAVAGQSIGMLSHTWSLAVEEQFYIFWPAVLLAGLRFGRSRLALAVLLLVVLDIPYRLMLDLNGGFMHVFVGTDTRGDALLLGCVMALLEIRWHSAAGWIGLVGIGALAAVWPADPGLGAQILCIPAAAVAGTFAVAGCPTLLAWRPLAFVGTISYGLYLWHGLVVWWQLPWPVAAPLSIAIAVVSYYALERPFLRLKDRLGRSRSVSISAPAPTPAGVPQAAVPAWWARAPLPLVRRRQRMN